MVISKVAVSFLVLITFASTPSWALKKSEYELFQDYALAACIAQAYGNGDIYKDSIDALNGYRARSNVPLESYLEINELIRNWLKKPYLSKEGEKTEIAACIDVIKSSEMKEIFAKFNPCKEKSFWSDSDLYIHRCPNEVD